MNRYEQIMNRVEVPAELLAAVLEEHREQEYWRAQKRSGR